MPLYEKNYKLAGGKEDFSAYYYSTPAGEKFVREFGRHMSFAAHNLATDGFVNKFDLVVCRNVLIYFDKELQKKVFRLFDLSLGPQSFLGLGEKETIKFSPLSNNYKQIWPEKIWQKM
jgi:chemotaxis protein methyltransferase CheR